MLPRMNAVARYRRDNNFFVADFVGYKIGGSLFWGGTAAIGAPVCRAAYLVYSELSYVSLSLLRKSIQH